MLEVISGREYPAKVIPLIEKAVSNIDIVVFDWRWYPQDPGAVCQLFNQAVLRAARRKVKIRVIANNSVLRAARRKVKIRVIANNDQIIDILKKEGCQAKRLRTTKLVHCKLVIIDDQIVVTGSHNFTQSAFQMNLELSVIIGEDVPKHSFIDFFNNLWSLG